MDLMIETRLNKQYNMETDTAPLYENLHSQPLNAVLPEFLLPSGDPVSPGYEYRL